MTMKVFVAGATGAIGKPLVTRLVQAGHEVTALTRSPAKAEGLRAAGAEPVIGDALDREAIVAAVQTAQPEVVVHELTAITDLSNLRKFDQGFEATNRLRTEGTDNLLAAARAAGARRFIAQSFGGWPYAREGGPVKSEDDPLTTDPPGSMRETFAAIRYLEDAVTAAEGIEGVVLRYGGFYGPGTSMAPGGETVELVRKRRFPIVGDGGGVWSLIHVDDAAAATVAAIERGAPGLYNVVDDEPAPVREWLPVLAQALGAKPPRHVPTWIGRLAAGDAAVTMMTAIRGSSNAKAKRELGWQPRYGSWREGFPAELAAP
jgi:nucleoside-diphosphate-sugar epimerase